MAANAVAVAALDVRPTTAGWWQRLAHDLETKRQLVTVGLVALFVIGFEVVFFYAAVVPRVRDAIQWMLKRPTPAMDPDARAALDTYLEFMDQQERKTVAAANHATVVYAFLIALLPLVLIAVLYASSAPLRHARSPASARDGGGGGAGSAGPAGASTGRSS